jgi:hypothetical protein
MQRSPLYSRGVIITILILQIIPLMMFPMKSFSATSQEWWLPALLAVMVLVADFQIIVRRTVALWPWYLIGFAQGFNIISRLMMVWVNATSTSGPDATINWTYLILTSIAMLLSTFMLWYAEKPQVRIAAVHG